MRRSPVARFEFVVVSVFLLLLAACGGGKKTTPAPTIAKVTVTPSPVSVDFGKTVQLTATAADSSGTTITGKSYTFASSDSNVVTISNSGLLCGGTWDSLTTPVVCKAPASPATTTITATVDGVTSDPVTVYVHRPVDRVEVSTADTGCVSQTGTRQFTATAFSNGTDVTSTVGTNAFTWSSSAASVATIDNTGLATAVTPGLTQIYASVSGVKSTPANLTTCAVDKISLHVKDSTDTSVTLDKSGTATLVADVTDTAGNTLTTTNVHWTSSQPVVASAASGSVVGAGAGTSTVTVICSDPDCNIGLNRPIYSNAVVVKVNGTTATTVFAASKDGTSIVPIDTTTDTAGTAITNLGDKPNSMIFNASGTRLYVGTATGLIVVDPTGKTAASPITQIPGKVLAVSPNGTYVVVSDGSKVYIYNTVATSGNLQTLSVPGAVAASFVPDSTKAYIVGGGSWTVWIPNRTVFPQSISGTTGDVSMLATGAFGYIAGTAGGVGVRATCDDSQATGVSLSTNPTQIQALPNGTGMVVVHSPDISVIDAASQNVGCPPAVTNTVAKTVSLGSSFTAQQLILTPDGTKAFVTSDQSGVLLGYNLTNGTSAPISLVGGVTATLTGGVTLDSNQLYVGAAGTKTVHHIDLTTGSDVKQIQLDFTPDFVAVQPK